MKVVYTIPVLPGVMVPVPPGTPGMTVGSITASWKTSEAGYLEAVMLERLGAEMRYNANGAILPTYPELEEEVYRAANFISNRIFVQTAYDVIYPDFILQEAPAMSPETQAEEMEFRVKHKLIWKDLPIGWNVHAPFEPADYPQGFDHSAAHGYFADATRSRSDFQQFELFYKVVEYFFPEEGIALDAAVSAHVLPHDAAFTQPILEELRLLRNRSIHPRARRGHVNPQNIANVREVHARLPQMRKLASLLLANPTF